MICADDSVGGGYHPCVIPRPEMSVISLVTGLIWQGKLTVSEKWTDGITDFLHVDTDSQKFKADQKNFWLGMVKNWCGQSGHGTLKLTVSQKWIYEITDFLHASVNSGKLKVDSVIFGWVQSKMAMTF